MLEIKMPDFEDRTIECVECHDQFLFEAGEARFYFSKGLVPPRRCPSCRQARRATIAQRPNDSGTRAR